MYVEQLYTGCLAEAAYYIESNGEAAIVDPLRETGPYLEKAKSRGAKIKYVLETHFHADFVSGHLDLAKKSGAKIVFGPTAQPNYEAHVAEDGELLPLGNVHIKVLHTPGHTMESTTYLLLDEAGNEHGIFTGDTLFIGDVGRPDLAVKSDLSREDLAGHLFDSLRNKIMPLRDETVVYPGHGAGSACGKMMSKETTDTLGRQKKLNYALRADMTREEFILEVTEGLVAPPQYFPKNAVLNKMGYEDIDEVMGRGTVGLSLEEFASLAEDDRTLIIDTRNQAIFVKGFIPGSIFIGIDDNFAPWLGTLVPDLKQPILLIADEDRVEEVVTRMARVGYDNSLGFLKEGFDTWKDGGKEWDTLEEISAEAYDKIHGSTAACTLMDVRRESEYNSQHIEGAINIPLDFVNDHMGDLDRNTAYCLHCAGGYRSVIMASILKARGFEKLTNIQGGFNALKETELPMTTYVEPTTHL